MRQKTATNDGKMAAAAIAMAVRLLRGMRFDAGLFSFVPYLCRTIIFLLLMLEDYDGDDNDASYRDSVDGSVRNDDDMLFLDDVLPGHSRLRSDHIPRRRGRRRRRRRARRQRMLIFGMLPYPPCLSSDMSTDQCNHHDIIVKHCT